MDLKNTIKNHPFLKRILTVLFFPSNQARPRLWVKWFLFPFIIKKGRRTSIRGKSRLDIFPDYKFTVGNNAAIEDFCTVNNAAGNVYIGDRSRVGMGSVIIGPVTIGEDVRLAQNVTITALNHNYEDVTLPISKQGIKTEQVYIGDETWIGANAVILPGVFIGKHCVIAAGSIVTGSIPSFCVVAGNPARIIKKYNFETNNWDRTN